MIATPRPMTQVRFIRVLRISAVGHQGRSVCSRRAGLAAFGDGFQMAAAFSHCSDVTSRCVTTRTMRGPNATVSRRCSIPDGGPATAHSIARRVAGPVGDAIHRQYLRSSEVGYSLLVRGWLGVGSRAGVPLLSVIFEYGGVDS